MIEHNMRNNVMTSIREPKNNGVNSRVIQIFDSDIVHQNLVSLYKDKIA